jgi:hypothetical protein
LETITCTTGRGRENAALHGMALIIIVVQIMINIVKSLSLSHRNGEAREGERFSDGEIFQILTLG